MGSPCLTEWPSHLVLGGVWDAIVFPPFFFFSFLFLFVLYARLVLLGAWGMRLNSGWWLFGDAFLACVHRTSRHGRPQTCEAVS